MKKALAVILVAVVLVAVVALFLVRSAEDKLTEDVVSRANRLAIPSGWTQLVDIVRREQLLCISTNPCPSINRRWETGTELTLTDLQAIASPAGITLKVEGTCQRQANVGGDTSLCSGVGNDGTYVYTLTAVSPGVGEKDQFTLDIRPLH